MKLSASTPHCTVILEYFNIKEKCFLTLPSSLSRYSSAPKTKRIFQMAKLESAYSFILKYSKITVWKTYPQVSRTFQSVADGNNSPYLLKRLFHIFLYLDNNNPYHYKGCMEVVWLYPSWYKYFVSFPTLTFLHLFDC